MAASGQESFHLAHMQLSRFVAMVHAVSFEWVTRVDGRRERGVAVGHTAARGLRHDEALPAREEMRISASGIGAWRSGHSTTCSQSRRRRGIFEVGKGATTSAWPCQPGRHLGRERHARRCFLFGSVPTATGRIFASSDDDHHLVHGHRGSEVSAAESHDAVRGGFAALATTLVGSTSDSAF